MGSATRNSTGRKAIHRQSPKRKDNSDPLAKLPELIEKFPQLEITEVLSNLTDATAVIATATKALEHAQAEEGSVSPKELGAEILTLGLGVQKLQGWLGCLDIALMQQAQKREKTDTPDGSGSVTP